MLILSFFLYALIGISAGVVGGLLGISGGLITVPSLFFLFHLLDFPKEHLMHLAIGTSLASMVFNTISATWAHSRNRMVLWDTVKKIVPGILLGSLIGAMIADYISGVVLQMIFGAFACLLGIRFIRHKKVSAAEHRLPSTLALNGIGVSIAGLSNILGIGGGILIVPTLLHYDVAEKKAIGTSAALGCLITSMGALSYLFFGTGEFAHSQTVGYLYLPAFFVIAISTFLAAPYGAKLTHRLHASTLKRLFGGVLVLTGLLMFLG